MALESLSHNIPAPALHSPVSSCHYRSRPGAFVKTGKQKTAPKSCFLLLAERVGFEPTEPEGSTDFESAPL
jgi:hypothetical protein